MPVYILRVESYDKSSRHIPTVVSCFKCHTYTDIRDLLPRKRVGALSTGVFELLLLHASVDALNQEILHIGAIVLRT